MWRKEWEGAISVPFYSTRHGNWICSTPTHDGECLDDKTGDERLQVDFVKEFNATIPAFGFVWSPLIDGVFVQAQMLAGQD